MKGNEVMNKKKLCFFALATSFAVLSTGCSGYSDINELNAMSSVNTESDVSENYSLSYTEEQNAIYAQVSDRTMLDLTTLEACDNSEISQVTTYMDNVNEQIMGRLPTSNYVMPENYSNYLIWEFEKTPYCWLRDKTVIRGVDPSSRSIVVDVVYKTIGEKKHKYNNSLIVRGSDTYDDDMESRFIDWQAYLRAKDYGQPDAPEQYQKFVDKYGEPQEIFDQQVGKGLTRIVQDIHNQVTYNGCVDSTADNDTGTMTVRYVLVPKYALGVNLGIECEHLYVLDYKLKNDITVGKDVLTDEGYNTIANSIYKTLYSYFKCIDENDYRGLNKLVHDFSKHDKYFYDEFNTSYTKMVDDFTISLFKVRGTKISCGVNIHTKQRCKGSDMTFPVYNDRYIAQLGLEGDQIVINNITLLSRELIGEPEILTESANLNGFTQTISVTDESKTAIEDIIGKVSMIQLKGEFGKDYEELVEKTLSEREEAALKKEFQKISGDRKVIFIKNYNQGTANYISLSCRDVFIDGDEATECNVIYEFINRNGEWKLFDYTIEDSVILDTTNINKAGCLYVLTKTDIEEYNTQTTSVTNVDTNTLADISVTIEHTHENKKFGIQDNDMSMKDDEEGMTEDGLIDDELADEIKTKLNDTSTTVESLLSTSTELDEALLEKFKEKMQSGEIASEEDAKAFADSFVKEFNEKMGTSLTTTQEEYNIVVEQYNSLKNTTN